MTENEISAKIVDAAFAIHSFTGPGMLESSYKFCLIYELEKRGLSVLVEYPMPLTYKDVKLNCGYRFDIWVEKKVIIEVKAVSILHENHFAQMMTYLKLSGCKLGLLINFNVPRIKDGMRRVVNGL